MKKDSSLIIGVLAAAAAGVLVGILIAPAKGSDTRNNLLNSVDELGEKINDLVEAGKNKINTITNEFKDDVNALKANATATVSHTKKIVS